MIPLMKLLMHCLNQKSLEFLLTCDNLPLPLISKFRVYFYPCVGVKVHKVSGVNIRIRCGSRSFRKEGASLPSSRNGTLNQIKQWNSTLTHLILKTYHVEVNQAFLAWFIGLLKETSMVETMGSLKCSSFGTEWIRRGLMIC